MKRIGFEVKGFGFEECLGVGRGFELEGLRKSSGFSLKKV